MSVKQEILGVLEMSSPRLQGYMEPGGQCNMRRMMQDLAAMARMKGWTMEEFGQYATEVYAEIRVEQVSGD